jgi:hypothetical protein
LSDGGDPRLMADGVEEDAMGTDDRDRAGKTVVGM